MFLRQIFDPSLAQYAYLVGCQKTGEAIVFDPERDIDRYLELADENGLRIAAVAETHIHADFLSGALEILERLPGVTAYLSDEGDADWKYEWAKERDDVRLLKDGDTFRIGRILVTAVHTPGHTPEHLSFLVEDQGGGADQPMAGITGDFVFVGDVGRPDLLETAAGQVGAQEPSAHVLFQSVKAFAQWPDYLQVLPAHGAGSACGKALGSVPWSTVGYEKRFNPALLTAFNEGEEAFVDWILHGQPEPPLYFARMKRDNKMGPALLGELPGPGKCPSSRIPALLAVGSNVFVDTRSARHAFFARHLRGSLYAPLKGGFNTVVGSFVSESESIYLLLERESDLEEAVRQLVRIGLDRIEGYALLNEVLEDAHCRDCVAETRSVTTADLAALVQKDPSAVVLDVRTAAEHAESHVPGSVNIAYTRLRDRMHEIPPGPTYLVHCGSGLRAAYATALLIRHGRDAIHLDGSADVLPAAH